MLYVGDIRCLNYEAPLEGREVGVGKVGGRVAVVVVRERFLMVFLFIWFSHGVPMMRLWCSCGVSIIFLCCSMFLL